MTLKDKNMLNKMIRSANLLLLLAAFFLLFWSLGDRALWSSEGRWAEITREMFTSGDFFHPTIGGEPYFDKPLFTYWVIAAFSAVTGRLDEFIIRLPSALAALVTLVCTVYLGRRLWSRQTGWLAGGLLLTSYGLLMYSHVASAETENLAAIMLAVTWYWTRRDRPGFVMFLVFYLILFVGSHMKGLTAFVVPVLVILPDLLRQRRWRWLLWPSHWLALGIGIAVYFGPFVYAALSRPGSYEQSGLSMAFRENILRYVQPFDHKDPIYLYLGAVPLLILPWVPILIGALIASISNWKKLDGNTRWLIQAILIIFVFFTLSGSRRNYYILPILPFCTLLMAVFLVELSQEVVRTHRDRGLWIQKHILVVAAVKSLPHERVAFWHKCEDKVLFYLKWDPPITLLADENALRAFLESEEPGIVISQDRYVSKKAASMLPSQPAYTETRYAWESPDICEKKLKAWLIDADVSQIAMESKEADSAK